MWIRNTSSHPTPEVRRLVKFAADLLYDTSVTRYLCVNVRNSKAAWAGRAYIRIPLVSNAPKTAKHLVVLRIGQQSYYPEDNLHTYSRWVRVEPGENTTGLQTRGVGKPGPDGKMVHWLEKLVTRKTPYGGAQSPYMILETWQEGLMVLAAHEIKHIEQHLYGQRFVESECERAAAKALEEYRLRVTVPMAACKEDPCPTR